MSVTNLLELTAAVTLAMGGSATNQSVRVGPLVTEIVTNAVAGDNHRGCALCEMVRRGYLIYHPPHDVDGPYEPETKKWITYTVVRKESIRIDVHGWNTVYATNLTTLTNWTEYQTLVSMWVSGQLTNGAPTNIVAPRTSLFFDPR